MSSLIERPLYYENQILGAADLTAGVEHSRGRQARHERFLHLWGITSGLSLADKEKQTATGTKYSEITLSPGAAVDGTGREIVVRESEPLSANDFDQHNVAIADQEAWYPVFLVGRDEPASQPPLVVGACQNSLPVRKVEGYEISFGRPGDELDPNKSSGEADVTAGPGNAEWKVLLGFVQWDAAIKKFKGRAESAGGIGRRYAGVQADVVAARGGQLTLRTRAQNESGKPAFLINETEGGLLQFGKLTDQGVVTPVFSVNARGEVEAKGAIKGAVTPGSVQIQSGVITDGMVVPLPPGITEEQVEKGKVTLHIQLTPSLPGTFPPSTIEVPFECEVESATRRALVRFRRVDISGSTYTDLPGACQYIVLASVPAATGG